MDFELFRLSDLIVPIGTITILEIKSYILRRFTKNNLNKIGELKKEIDVIGLNKYTGNFKGIAYILGGLTITLSVIAGLKSFQFNNMLAGIGYGLSLIYLPSKVTKQHSIKIGDKGFMHQDFICKWEELQLVEWDRDIKQQQWGLKFKKEGSIVYHKIYVKRELKEELEKLINENFHK